MTFFGIFFTGLRWHTKTLIIKLVNINSGNGSVISGTEPLPEPTFMWFMVGAGVIGRPFLSFLDGTPHKQAW